MIPLINPQRGIFKPHEIFQYNNLCGNPRSTKLWRKLVL